ncbi:uncharacterized protein LOC122859872 [Aphidius gifuensis]|uniref:uncharacterized protein LOC122859872 n=1 Tax=Aphidius gifuensis TaxID=684658 RepID=UPI001CDCFD0A|nr:uncharacterized protein LOC122859872 [Aphidius gifuensis]
MEPSKFAFCRRKRKIINLCVKTFDDLDTLRSVPPDLFDHPAKITRIENDTPRRFHFNNLQIDTKNYPYANEEIINTADNESRSDETFRSDETENEILSAYDEEGHDRDRNNNTDINDFLEVDENDENEENDQDQQQMHTVQKSFINWSMAHYVYEMLWRPAILAKDHILVFLTLSLVFHWTYEATSMVFTWINQATFNAGLPVYKKSLWKALGRNEVVETRHYICEYCQAYLGIIKPVRCSSESCLIATPQSSISYFVEIDLESQIRDIFAIPDIYDQFQYRFTRTKRRIDALEDVYDGELYKRLSEPGEFLSNRNNFTFTFNTDGASVSDSSKSNAWPVFLQINESPPHLRKRHMLLSTVWVGTGHPVANTFLKPLVNQLNHLYETGITWKYNGDYKLTSKFMVLLCSVDSVARPLILRMTQFNGAFGCNFCYQNGCTHGDSFKYPLEKKIILRTHEETVELGEQSLNSGTRILGVIGPSILFGLFGFDCMRGMVVEPLHNLFLGVAKQYTKLLLEAETYVEDQDKRRYVSKSIAESIIDMRLSKIRPPSRLTRRPRSIKDMKLWKGQEWRNWIQYYCLICLEGVLKPKYLKHLSLLSQAIYILNSDSITSHEINQARQLLQDFVKKYEQLFGKQAMTYNIHLLLHITDTVENAGPLFSYNASVFESWNRKILQNISSPNGRIIQIITRFLIKKCLELLYFDNSVHETTRKFVYTLIRKFKFDVDLEVDGKFQGVGKRTIRVPTDWENTALNDAGFEVDKLGSFSKVLTHKIEFRTFQLNKETKYCNNVAYTDKFGFGIVKSIIQFEHNNTTVSGCIMNVLKSEKKAFNTNFIDNVIETKKYIFVTSNEVLIPAMAIHSKFGFRATKLSNCWETD